MKKNFLITSAVLSFSALLGVGALVGVASAKAPVKAEASTTTGKLVAKLGNEWGADSAKLAAYLTDDTDNWWSELQPIGSNTMFVFDYSVSFTPTKLIWVRMDPAATSGNWDQKWNQTGDLALADATYLPNEWNPTTAQCSQWTITGNVYTSANEFTSPKVSMTVSTVEIVGDNHNEPQVSGKVTLAKDEEFKVVNVSDDTWSGYYGCDSALDNCFEGGSKEKHESEGNIKCLVAGTYDFYFNTETKRTWISRDDIVEADGFASYFNSNVGCDPEGKSDPTGWSTVATEYAKLSNDAKDFLYGAKAGTSAESGSNVERCLFTYDYAVAHHSNLEKFIKDSHNNVRPVNVDLVVGNTYSPITISSNNAFIIITIVAVASVTAIGTTLLIKRRRDR